MLIPRCLLGLACIASLLSGVSQAHASQPEQFAGHYRLVSEVKTNLDGSPFSCGSNKDGSDMPCQTSKGKIVLELLNDKSLVYFEAYTTKRIGTSGFMGNYQVQKNQVVERNYTGDGLVCCNSSLKQLKLEGDKLIRVTEGANFKSTIVWQKVIANEVTDKYLERELEKQRKFYLQVKPQ